jgi:hypothetical protein
MPTSWPASAAISASRLTLTGKVTGLNGRGHVSDEVYGRAAAVFYERERGQVIAAGHQRVGPDRGRYPAVTRRR